LATFSHCTQISGQPSPEALQAQTRADWLQELKAQLRAELKLEFEQKQIELQQQFKTEHSKQYATIAKLQQQLAAQNNQRAQTIEMPLESAIHVAPIPTIPTDSSHMSDSDTYPLTPHPKVTARSCEDKKDDDDIIIIQGKGSIKQNQRSKYAAQSDEEMDPHEEETMQNSHWDNNIKNINIPQNLTTPLAKPHKGNIIPDNPPRLQ
jgi:hypothetical protein